MQIYENRIVKSFLFQLESKLIFRENRFHISIESICAFGNFNNVFFENLNKK